jgi:hypothetical protein
MPHSLEPEPADDEVECARCGAHVHISLSRCPNCGVNLYEPEDEIEETQPQKLPAARRGLLARLDEFVHRLTKKPYAVDELFGAAIHQAELFNDLLARVGGDRTTAERLVEYEHQRLPQGSRMAWIRNAIRRWERDNRTKLSR